MTEAKKNVAQSKHLEAVREKLLERKAELEQELADLYQTKEQPGQVQDPGDHAHRGRAGSRRTRHPRSKVHSSRDGTRTIRSQLHQGLLSGSGSDRAGAHLRRPTLRIARARL